MKIEGANWDHIIKTKCSLGYTIVQDTNKESINKYQITEPFSTEVKMGDYNFILAYQHQK